MIKNPIRKTAFKITDLVKVYESTADKVSVKKTIYPETSHIDRITCDSDLAGTVIFYDGNKKIFTIDKKKLYAATALALSEYGGKGFDWHIPRYDLALIVDYYTEFELRAEGDTTGLVLWLDKS